MHFGCMRSVRVLCLFKGHHWGEQNFYYVWEDGHSLFYENDHHYAAKVVLETEYCDRCGALRAHIINEKGIRQIDSYYTGLFLSINGKNLTRVEK